MRLTLLAAVLLFSLHTSLAAVPASVSLAVDSMAKSPVKNTIHDKTKGTVGFISGLLLGPVGLGSVYLFSHNRAQRKAAKKGCTIFAMVVVAAALCWLIVLGTKNAGGSSGSHHSNSGWANNINFPSTGSSSPSTKKKPAPAQLPADWPSKKFLKY